MQTQSLSFILVHHNIGRGIPLPTYLDPSQIESICAQRDGSLIRTKTGQTLAVIQDITLVMELIQRTSDTKLGQQIDLNEDTP
ncbi:hypothetical protein SAMN05421753_104179 [Planctomicrobium piriforme]|uniref:Uncharacterized protein n=1 Tax=Planctomicrobium piriforme TaxID=1576369 RepID=A0A1I3EDT2_9PLAN|nr:hypothetical protein SAMN05421753_104179 [Planctomicrobium piriforme]